MAGIDLLNAQRLRGLWSQCTASHASAESSCCLMADLPEGSQSLGSCCYCSGAPNAFVDAFNYRHSSIVLSASIIVGGEREAWSFPNIMCAFPFRTMSCIYFEYYVALVWTTATYICVFS